MHRRLPAEWEEQDAVLLAWPHAATDWADTLDLVEPVISRIAVAISRFERVLIVAPQVAPVRARLKREGADPLHLLFAELPTNDTWARDFGPITVLEDGAPVVLDFGFNAWGLKFAANHDNLVSRGLAAARLFRAPVRVPGLVLEGGSIDSDGAGTLLTTTACLLSPNRNPHLDRAGLERALADLLGAERVLWLEHGALAGDDTDAHIDTLARFCPDDTIAYVRCDDPADEHFAPLAAMEAELQGFRTTAGRPYRLVALPWPRPVFDTDGHRLPATYANFLVVNNAVLVPTYRDPQDAAALETLAALFPGRQVIGIDALPLIHQHGSLHCLTMQLPRGTLV